MSDIKPLPKKPQRINQKKPPVFRSIGKEETGGIVAGGLCRLTELLDPKIDILNRESPAIRDAVPPSPGKELDPPGAGDSCFAFPDAPLPHSSIMAAKGSEFQRLEQA